ncbi:hypothetical protein ABPG77_008479 [Micractinium sp. CCAP 211/92]
MAAAAAAEDKGGVAAPDRQPGALRGACLCLVECFAKSAQRRPGQLLHRPPPAGLLDGVTSAAAFVLYFLAYEAQTGVNLARSPRHLPKVMLLVWASKHVTRPFRWAAVAGLAPLADRLLDTLQRRMRLRSRGVAFALCVACTAVCCLGAVGALLLSRWVQPVGG